MYLVHKKQQGQCGWSRTGRVAENELRDVGGGAGGQILRGLVGHFKNLIFSLNR